jgi:PAS domain S-box-containing protein
MLPWRLREWMHEAGIPPWTGGVLIVALLFLAWGIWWWNSPAVLGGLLAVALVVLLAVSQRELEARRRAVAALTEQNEVHDALHASEKKYRQLVELAQEGIWAIDTEARTTFVNPRMAQMLGYAVDEMLGRSLFGFLEETSREPAQVGLGRCRLGIRQTLEISFRRKDGTVLYTRVSGTSLTDDSGRIVGGLAVISDLTERKRLEEQVRQAHKLEAIGRLAGGVAHDFNNLLTVIIGYTELAQAAGSDRAPSSLYLQEVKRAAERAAALTRQPLVLDLNAVVQGAEKLLRRLIGEHIRLDTVLDPALPRIKADPSQIEQVIVNLAVNARDAMPQGGQLTLQTMRVGADEVNVPDLLPAASLVLLQVSDTGHGMDESTLAHLFEPFFTTKGVGQGTGLGLATVHGIVEQSGGRIQVVSEPGRGTTFQIYFRGEEEMEAAPEAPPSLAPAPRGTETVLVVEDEEAVRKVALLALRRSGYTVLEAANGVEALQLGERHPGPIHLLVTDLVMPQMSGRQLAQQLTSHVPDLRVLYLSGYTDDTAVRQEVEQEGGAYLQKPFTPAGLAWKVREVLDLPASGLPVAGTAGKAGPVEEVV